MMILKGSKRPLKAVATWVRRQTPKTKAFLALFLAMVALLFLRLVVENHDNFFVAAEAVHALGICLLIYKLTKEKSCVGTNFIIYDNFVPLVLDEIQLYFLSCVGISIHFPIFLEFSLFD